MIGHTLQPEDQISHYRVVGPLGAGGMGEVYLAQDQTLERNVAIKILPPELVRNEDRVRRFVQEAKSASSLNHPNIVTIYEIGQDEVHSSSGESTTESLQYISMELVSGKTLGVKIHDEKTDLRTLLGYLAQAAEGIAKAHAAGIVHRDLKPGNIMVSDDGFAKVLDFGLAKLTEKRGDIPPSDTAMTEVAEHTGEGTVLGSVHYMSPEQVQGKSVDFRSDIFSFGCILYEAATRRRPFIADSNVETMHKIINEKPAPIEEIAPTVPAELRRLVRRCLNKSPEQRLQSMKDVAIELREIADEYDSLSASTTSGSGSGPIVAVPPRRTLATPIVVGAAVVAVAAIAFGVWGVHHARRAPAHQPFETMHMTPQTSLGNVTDCALSPDGRYLAYIVGREGQSGLHVRQVATGGDVELIPTQDGSIRRPSFSPDGNYVFYLRRKPDAPQYSYLMSMPSLGGPEQQRAFDVDTRITFSPDGKQVCFYRGIPQKQTGKLFILDLDTGKARELATMPTPERFPGSPVWSPDGRRIAVITIQSLPKLQSTIEMVDARSGEKKDFFTRPNATYNDVAWLPDGTGLAICGQDLTVGINGQVFLLTYPGADLRRVTNDFNEYRSVTAASGLMAAVRSSRTSNIFVAPLDGGAVRPITSSTSPENSPLGFTTSPGHVIYAGVIGKFLGAWSVPVGGGEARPITAGNAHMIRLHAAANTLFYDRFEAGKTMHVWRCAVDGTDAHQVTKGPGEVISDVSPDGRTMAFSYSDSTRGVWIVSADGTDPKELSEKALPGSASFSPDGTRIMVLTWEVGEGGLAHVPYSILPVSGGDPIATVRAIPQARSVQWGPDGQSLGYIDSNDSAYNVFLQPIDGSAPKQVTHFTDGRVLRYAWSREGRHLLVVRAVGDDQNAWVCAADGSQPRQVTHFTGQDILGSSLKREANGVVLQAGTSSSDAVIIADFQ